ncbi:Centromere protein O [Dissostichus eleginoides]|uniref:Centromere protein O n=1 Tax=Dissostichus eleginoides TaxID=100907 RepID=A0AAD9CT77_DISEL|nr:Centromere protein O [Dissostichus eleginoides]
MRLVRHNVPPFIPLTLLIEQSRIQTDIWTLLDPLSCQLKAFTARKRQLQLLKIRLFLILRWKKTPLETPLHKALSTRRTRETSCSLSET